MRIELERGEDQYDVIYLDPQTVGKLVKWLTSKGESRLFNYPNESGNWNILDVDTRTIDEGIAVLDDGEQLMLGGFES